MVLNISCLSLNKLRGYFLVKWLDWKDGLSSWFLTKNPVETYQGLQGSKKKTRKFGWAGLDITSVLKLTTLQKYFWYFQCQFLFIQPEGASSCLVCYYKVTARLKTSYDCLRPEWQNTRAKWVYLYQTLWAKRAQFFSKLNKWSELISISTKIDYWSKWMCTKLNEWRGWFFWLWLIGDLLLSRSFTPLYFDYSTPNLNDTLWIWPLDAKSMLF